MQSVRQPGQLPEQGAIGFQVQLRRKYRVAQAQRIPDDRLRVTREQAIVASVSSAHSGSPRRTGNRLTS
jgi:hypothetical protein